MTATLLLSCATQKPKQNAEESERLAELQLQKELAHSSYKANRFYESLYHWQTLNELYPDNKEFKDRIFILKKLIKRRVKIYIDRATVAMDRGEFGDAVNEFEKVLILDPENNVAIKYLEQLNQDKKHQNDFIPDAALSNDNIDAVLDEEEKNSANELFNLEKGLNYYDQREWNKAVITLNRHIKNYPKDDIARSYLSNAHLELSRAYNRSKKFSAAIKHFEFAIRYTDSNKAKLTRELKLLKSEIAHYYYIEGVKVYKKNRNLAISYWRKTLKYNPNHLSANARLKKEGKKK